MVALNQSRRDFHGYALHRLLHQHVDYVLHAARLLIEGKILPFMMVDNSAFPPNRLTIPLGPAYLSFN
jgi:hypothetical protein